MYIQRRASLPRDQNNVSASIGICAYNEEDNVERLLTNLLYEQNLPFNFEVIAVCSGCTDKTPSIVRKFCEKDQRVRLIVEPERRGKASAVNEILSAYKGKYLIFVPADVIPEKGSLERLLKQFKNQKVGVAGGRPTLINKEERLNGVEALAHLMWRIHNQTLQILNHENVLTHASGELFCIRRGIVTRIPAEVINDDAYIAMKANQKGFLVRFDPNARVYIKVPSTFADLIRQRKRIMYGHYQIKKIHGSFPRTIESMAFYDPKRVIRILTEIIRGHPKETHKLIAAVIFEMMINFLAFLDMIRGKSHVPWKKIATKN
jgi:biofilm PGA synthesis N-glycosyltransferase PgaC